MKISAKSDYALRAAVALAEAGAEGFVKAEQLAQRTGVPLEFLQNILGELRTAGLVTARRGSEGGYALSELPQHIPAAAVLAAVGSALVDATDAIEGAVGALWERLSVASRAVLESVTLADLARTPAPGSSVP